MVISQLNKYYLGLFMLLALMSGCTLTSKCPDNWVNQFTIENWRGSLPKTVDLIRYKKDSKFKVVQEIYPHEHLFVSEAPPADMSNTRKPQKAVRIEVGTKASPEAETKLDFQPISSDYKLILDNKIEYRITDIQSIDNMTTGCRFKSLKVNDHVHSGLYFEQSEGEPVKQ